MRHPLLVAHAQRQRCRWPPGDHPVRAGCQAHRAHLERRLVGRAGGHSGERRELRGHRRRDQWPDRGHRERLGHAARRIHRRDAQRREPLRGEEHHHPRDVRPHRSGRYRRRRRWRLRQRRLGRERSPPDRHRCRQRRVLHLPRRANDDRAARARLHHLAGELGHGDRLGQRRRHRGRRERLRQRHQRLRQLGRAGGHLPPQRVSRLRGPSRREAHQPAPLRKHVPR